MNRSSKAKNGMNVRQNMYKSSAEQVVNGDRLSSRPRGYSDEKTDYFRMYVVYIKKKEKNVFKLLSTRYDTKATLYISKTVIKIPMSKIITKVTIREKSGKAL